MLWRVGKGRRLKTVSILGDNCAAFYLRSDWWLIRGISKFVGGLFCRKTFGNTDYLYWVREELQKVCLYEAEHTLPPLCSSITPSPSAASSKNNPWIQMYSLGFHSIITIQYYADFCIQSPGSKFIQ